VQRRGSGRHQRDSNGSAKAALLGIDRSLAAWRELDVQGERGAQAVRTLVTILEQLRAGIEERFPQALLFLRPGFDDVYPWRRACFRRTGVGCLRSPNEAEIRTPLRDGVGKT
jgi:hypothetical protein